MSDSQAQAHGKTNQPAQTLQQSPQQQKIASKILEIKYNRIEELNNRLKQSLQKERIPASSVSLLIINNTQTVPDYLIPYLWKLDPKLSKFRQYQQLKESRAEKEVNVGCCTIV